MVIPQDQKPAELMHYSYGETITAYQEDIYLAAGAAAAKSSNCNRLAYEYEDSVGNWSLSAHHRALCSPPT